MVLKSGTHLGPYEIVAPLGAGGMGEVYRARDTRLGREVAIKILPERLATDPSAVGRFEQEARAVAALSHPNILAIHDVGSESGIAYAVTELLDGSTLRDKLDGAPDRFAGAPDVQAGQSRARSAALILRSRPTEHSCSIHRRARASRSCGRYRW